MTRLVPVHVAAAPLMLAAALVAAPRANAQQAAGASPWTLGMDATFGTEQTRFANVDGRSRTSLDLPTQRVRIGYRASPALQLEVPLGVGYASTDGFSLLTTLLGLDANLSFAARGAVRPFAGVGARLRYLRAHEEQSPIAYDATTSALRATGSTRSASQYGFAARAGIDWQALPSLGFRPALVYERINPNDDKDVAGLESFALSLGATMHFAPQLPAASPPPFQLSVGADLSRIGFGRISDGFGDQIGGGSATRLQLPTPAVGLYFPVTRSRQVMVGSNVQLQRAGTSGMSFTAVQLQPRVEYDLNPRYRTERGVRVGAHANVLHERAAGDGDSDSRTRLGAGGDLSLTFPVAPGLLSRVGIGADFFGADKDTFAPSQHAFSLKFGFDAL